MNFEASETFAAAEDAKDVLARFRNEFHFPMAREGKEKLYFCGNSLGLMPKSARSIIERELDDWARFGVEGHFHGRSPWLNYHEFLNEPMGRVVGALPSEVVVMNTLTVNLHLMLAAFYRPTRERFKIVIEAGAFPSDRYAVLSQTISHSRALGFDPALAVLELKPRQGEACLRTVDIIDAIALEKPALILLGSVQYLTGQAFDIEAITRAGHGVGASVGFDLAHGVGNLDLKLHNWGPDFAVWCSYKYLNGGPGALGGCFVHDRHATDFSLPRLAGWWGHDKHTRFEMPQNFKPMPGAEGFQLSNPPILSAAPLRASLELFDRATMPALRAKSESLTGFLEFLIDTMTDKSIEIITPRDPSQRGAQLSLRVKGGGRDIKERLDRSDVICDFRKPDVIRVAPAPLYNSFMDIWRFFRVLVF